jgi:N-methylhydantoinase B
VLADVHCGFVTVEGAKRDYGVIVVDGALNQAATDAERAALRKTPPVLVELNGVKFDFGQERFVWEASFGAETMRRIITVLRRFPISSRQRKRQEIYAPVSAILERNGPIDAALLVAARAKVEILLRALEGDAVAPARQKVLA